MTSMSSHITRMSQAVPLTSSWRELTPEQQCVLSSAIGDCDLSALLYEWDPTWAESDELPMRRLGEAVLHCLDRGLIIVLPSTTDAEPVPLPRPDVEAALVNPRAWWNGEDGLEMVVWLVLTDAGEAVVAPLSANELYRYRNHQ